VSVLRGAFPAAIAFVLAVVGTGFVHTRIPPTRSVERGDAFIPKPELSRLLSLGFRSALADYYWLQAIQEIGGINPVDEQVATRVGKLIDLVTTLDPWVDHPYRFAAIWMTHSEQNVREANRLLRRGIRYHPDEWRDWFYLGFNHYFYLLENEQAAEALHQASLLPASPLYLPRLVARLRSATADIDVAETFLREMTRRAPNDEARAQYAAALDEIEVEKRARLLDRARKAYAELYGRDIDGIEDLVRGSQPILSSLPSPEPDSLPLPLRRGAIWQIDPESGQIVSSYYGSRYELHYSPLDRERAERWRQKRESKRSEAGDS